jgi:hypothetical protein
MGKEIVRDRSTEQERKTELLTSKHALMSILGQAILVIILAYLSHEKESVCALLACSGRREVSIHNGLD